MQGLKIMFQLVDDALPSLFKRQSLLIATLHSITRVY